MSHRKRNYHHENNPQPTLIQDYVEAKAEWTNYPAKIINGEMQIFVHGHWVDKKEFDNFFPMPNPTTFIQKREDIDSTHI